MKNLIFILLLLPAFTSFSYGAEGSSTAENPEKIPGWQKPSVSAGLNFSQGGFDNWTAGGENNLAWLVYLNSSADYDADKMKWQNSLKFKFGQISTEPGGTRKSDDEIRFDTLIKYKFGINLGPYAAGLWRTQIAPGYVYEPETEEVSAFMDPGYFRESAGIVYSPFEILSIRLGAAVNQTVTNKYSVDYGIKNEAGAEFVADLNTKLTDNIIVLSKAEFFSNLKAWDRITVNWDSTITAAINNWLNVNFNIVLRYDRNESTKRQVKNSLSAGLVYNFL